MANDWIPADDAEFNTFLVDQFAPYLAANAAALGLTPADVTAMTTQKNAWSYAWTGLTNALAALAAALAEKEAKRKATETVMRALGARAQANPTTTDAQREGLGITVRKKTRTPVPVPTSVPLLAFDTSLRATLSIEFRDSTTPDSKAKPPGVQGAEIREQIGGTAPLNPDAMAFLALDTRSPYRADFAATDVGKTVYFAARWVNTRGQHGPWSAVSLATVPS